MSRKPIPLWISVAWTLYLNLRSLHLEGNISSSFYRQYKHLFPHGVAFKLSPRLPQSPDRLLKCELSFNSIHSTWMLFIKSSVLSTVILNTDTPVYEESQFNLRPDRRGNLQPNSEQKYRSISRINPL